MSFIDNNLLASEVVIYRANLHWVIFAPAFVYLLLSIALGICNLASDAPHQILWGVSLAALLLAILSGIHHFIRYKTSEFAVTNKRVLIKVGFIRRHSLEVLLHKVEGIGVNQSITGRILGYGTIVISGTGGTKEMFDAITAPLEFRKQVQAQLS